MFPALQAHEQQASASVACRSWSHAAVPCLPWAVSLAAFVARAVGSPCVDVQQASPRGALSLAPSLVRAVSDPFVSEAQQASPRGAVPLATTQAHAASNPRGWA